MKSDIEKEILAVVQSSLAAGIAKTLEASYGNPIGKLVETAVAERSGEILNLFTSAIDSALSADFRPALQEACAHKLARILVSKMEAEIEKKANDLRSNPETRAKITLAISKVIESL